MGLYAKIPRHSQYGIGSGKAEQIIVDERLTSRQIYNLEKLAGVQVIDRESLILDIFYLRATTTEAKLQIELAEIKYEIPRVRENAKLTSGNERAGKGAMDEYVVDVKFRDLKRRMSFIKEKLEEARKKRELYHHQGIKTGLPVASLVGYTSSGKTLLFNSPTNEHKQTIIPRPCTSRSCSTLFGSLPAHGSHIRDCREDRARASLVPSAYYLCYFALGAKCALCFRNVDLNRPVGRVDKDVGRVLPFYHLDQLAS